MKGNDMAEIQEIAEEYQVCNNCKYCDVIQSHNGFRYICHFLPPISVTLENDGQWHSSRFPKVKPDWYCGQWKLAEDQE